MKMPPFEYEPGAEPERYELDAPLPYRFDLDRRNFLKVLGGGIVILLLIDQAQAQQRGGPGGRGSQGEAPREISAWLHLDEQGAATVYTGKVEVGQDIRTSLAQVVAEELSLPLENIRLVMGDTDRTPFDAGTFGSRTTPVMAQQLRRVAAAARELLLDFAAEEWKTGRDSLSAADGMVVQKGTGRQISFGQLTRGRQLAQEVPDRLPTTPAPEWNMAGKSVPKINGRDFVTGKHLYTTDLSLPEMLHGKVLRPPAFGAALRSVDLEKARAMPGVVVVKDGDFVGVAAPQELAASRAIEALQAEWNFTPQISGDELFDYFKREADPGTARSSHRSGSVPEGVRAAEVVLKETYTIAYIAHAPLEPRAAVAQWEDGKLTVWTGTQRPFGVRSELARAFGLSEDGVRVIVPDTGSAYGGKHSGETALEAARLAKAAGRPVKLVWTREEEFTWAYFRPAGLIEVTGAARSDGALTAWEFHNYNSGASAIRTLYEVPHQRIEFHPVRSPLRQGSYRALAATANHFARETLMDELAHALRIDPLEFRLRNLNDPRLRAVLEAAAQAFGWGRNPEAGRGFGIAGGFEKGGYVATCVEVAAQRASGQVRVTRALTAFECGAIVNPGHLKSQVEGCVMMGLGGALFEAIQFNEGRILNPGFSRYKVPRFSDLPELEVLLLNRPDLPSAGAGETPIVAIAPAISNAIFQAAGVRLRSLPLAFPS